MDAERFDRLARRIGGGSRRRGMLGGASRRSLLRSLSALPVVGGLASVLAEADAKKGKGKGKGGNGKNDDDNEVAAEKNKAKRRNKQCRKKKAKACEGRCGKVTVKCKKRNGKTKRTQVDCGPCDCDPPCGVCETCTAARQCAPCAPCCDAVCCTQANAVCHEESGACCVPDAKAQTCAGKCGPVKNNCKKTVDCGPCTCDPPCGTCEICTADFVCEPCDPCCDDVCCDQANAICHGGTGACCVPDSKAQTCNNECGQVVNNCDVTVNCGPCACDPPCEACFICDEATTTCVPDPNQQGDPCGDPGQVCQADGSCACEANSCPASRVCVDGSCVPDPGTCTAGQNLCRDGVAPCGDHPRCQCVTTTSSATFCGIGSATCSDCSSDEDCATVTGPGSVCADYTGDFCSCSQTGRRACVAPCGQCTNNAQCGEGICCDGTCNFECCTTADCGANETCEGGICVCPGCRSHINNRCEQGDSNATCGTGGTRCVSCDNPTPICVNHVCTACDGTNPCPGTQCCSGGQCVVDCPACESCSGGVCAPCADCCADNTCQAGDAWAQCGADGDRCTECASGQVCAAGRQTCASCEFGQVTRGTYCEIRENFGKYQCRPSCACAAGSPTLGACFNVSAPAYCHTGPEPICEFAADCVIDGLGDDCILAGECEPGCNRTVCVTRCGAGADQGPLQLVVLD